MKRLRVRAGAKLVVYTWAEGSDHPVADLLLELPKQDRSRLYRELGRAADTWPACLRNDQKCRRFHGDENLYEFKAGHWRVLFFVEGDPATAIILTNAFWKRGAETPKRQIARARRIRELWLATRE
ncbi:MAG: hypothetical protein FJX75_08435 [Armatimonadetes bacterium]|nr:hypothetical protein [Armatimonadota bacterium]